MFVVLDFAGAGCLAVNYNEKEQLELVRGSVCSRLFVFAMSLQYINTKHSREAWRESRY